jgi:multidrug resistance efflux pump
MADPFARSLTLLESDRGRRYLWLIVLAGLLLLAWGLWFVLARVTIYERSTRARIEVIRAGHPVQSAVSATVLTSRLQLDRWVEQGEVLVELDATTHRLALEETKAEQNSLQEQLADLQREIEAEGRVLALLQDSGRLALKEARAKSRERSVVAQHAGQKANKLARLRKEGHISELDFLDARASARRERASLQALRAATSRERRRQQTAQEDRRALLEKLRGLVTRTRGQLAATNAKIKRLNHEIDQHQIRASTSGRLGEVLTLSAGRYIKEGERLATIIPHGKLGAVAEFEPAGALGRIRTSQPARIRLAGFPWLRYGSVPATVERVASEIRDGVIRVELDLHPQKKFGCTVGARPPGRGRGRGRHRQSG